MPTSPRLQAGALLFALVIAVSLSLAPAPAAPWRVLAGVVTAALAWQPLRVAFFHRGPGAVRAFEWSADGSWFIVQRNGVRRQVCLHPATAAIGPWVVLVWTDSPTPLVRRYYALVDAACVSAATFRALRGRLKLAARQGRHGVRGMTSPSARGRN